MTLESWVLVGVLVLLCFLAYREGKKDSSRKKNSGRRFLPKNDVMDTVFRPDGEPLPLSRPLVAPECSHPAVAEYIRIDHRAGPGSFADNFEGKVCVICGQILAEVQTL